MRSPLIRNREQVGEERIRPRRLAIQRLGPTSDSNAHRPDATAPGGIRLGAGWGSRPASRRLATAILMDHTGGEDRVDAQTHELFIDDALHAFPHRGPWRLRATAIDAWLADCARKQRTAV